MPCYQGSGKFIELIVSPVVPPPVFSQLSHPFPPPSNQAKEKEREYRNLRSSPNNRRSIRHPSRNNNIRAPSQGLCNTQSPQIRLGAHRLHTPLLQLLPMHQTLKLLSIFNQTLYLLRHIIAFYPCDFQVTGVVFRKQIDNDLSEQLGIRSAGVDGEFSFVADEMGDFWFEELEKGIRLN